MAVSDELERLAKLETELKAGGGDKRIQAQHDSGKLTARERLAILFDTGTFQELDLFVQHRCTNFGMDKVSIPADGVVTGYGKVNGHTVCAFAQDFTARGGTLGEMHAQKICRVHPWTDTPNASGRANTSGRSHRQNKMGRFRTRGDIQTGYPDCRHLLQRQDG
jgi:Acetyl-CoA carboxylase, carboxyltransferase component (subunits alpha and beta)